MARPLRIQFPGAFYHITSRGNERRPIFSADRDRQKLLSLLSEAIHRFHLSLHTYCLMENHYHLLLETHEPNLSLAMHFLNSAYTSYFNLIHQRSGHLFQGRYRAILVERDPYALVLSRYVHLNPVRAGLCRTPEDYFWSSYQAYLNPKNKPPWLETSFLLAYFGSQEKEARKRHREFVEEGVERKVPNPLVGVISGVLLGGEEFIDRVREKVFPGAGQDRDLPALRQLRKRPSLEELKWIVAASLKEDYRWARDVSIYLCRRYSGGTLREIGVLHGGMGESAVSRAIGRLIGRMEQDRQLKKTVEETEIKLKRLSRV